MRVATFVSSSASNHNSSSSISEGFSRPPTFIARSRSSSFALDAACSRSSAKSSALSPENSFNEIRKSRRMILKRLRSEFVAKRPSMNDAIWALHLISVIDKHYCTILTSVGWGRRSPTSCRQNCVGTPDLECQQVPCRVMCILALAACRSQRARTSWRAASTET